MRATSIFFAVAITSVTILAQETPRSPLPLVPVTSSELSAEPENASTGLYLGEVRLDLTPTTTSITVGKIYNGRKTGSTQALRLEVWATTTPPAFGQSIQVRVLSMFDLPFMLAAGEARTNVSTGPLTLNPLSAGSYYLTVALLEYDLTSAKFLYADLFTMPAARRFGPAILLGSLPRGLIQRPGSSGASDDFVVANLGNASANVELTQIGDFFRQTPASFTLGPEARQRVTIEAFARSNGFYRGTSVVTVNGIEAYRVPIRLLAAVSPTGLVKAGVQTKRVDVNGIDGASPSSQVTFTNSGTSILEGFVISDKAWIIPETDYVTIPPGGSVTINFTCDRKFRDDPSSTSVTGTISLIYLTGASGKTALDSPPTSFAGVVVTDTTQPQSTTGAIPALKAGEVALLIPGVGHVIGSGGKVFISDLSIVNGKLGTTVGDLKMYYSSSLTSKSTPTSSLAPSASLNLSDVVTSYFGEKDQGTIQVRTIDLAGLSIAANVFNKANPAGTYGSSIPAFRTDRALANGQKLVLSGLRADANAHTNIYLQEMSGTGAATATIDFYDRNGVKIGNTYIPPQPVASFGLLGLNAVVPQNAVSAVITNTSAAKLSAYATPVDDASGDTWAVADWTKQYQITGSEPMVIPVAGAKAGANNTNFRTDVSITNSGSSSATIDLTYYPVSGSPITKSVTLDKQQSQPLDDVIPGHFGVAGESVGWISVKPKSGTFAVSSRTYTKQSDKPATFGTGVPTLPASAALVLGQSKTFGGLEDSTTNTVLAAQGATFRTNLGLVEVGGKLTRVRVSVYFADGKSLAAGGAAGSTELDLQPNQFVQMTGLVKSVVGPTRDTDFGDLRGVQVKVEVISGDGGVVPYVTSTDNGTGDTVLRTE